MDATTTALMNNTFDSVQSGMYTMAGALGPKVAIGMLIGVGIGAIVFGGLLIWKTVKRSAK